jgi:hypothetical protein
MKKRRLALRQDAVSVMTPETKLALKKARPQ